MIVADKNDFANYDGMVFPGFRDRILTVKYIYIYIYLFATY